MELDLNPHNYYREQSEITEPGSYIHLFTDLPTDIPSLSRVVQGLIIHYRNGSKFNYTIPGNRIQEIDTRYVEKMLARIHELDSRSLTQERPLEKRLVGSCRDFATLFCSMARYQGIPTRVRIGFSAYFNRNFNHDHAIVECWDSAEHRWKLIDPEISASDLSENTLINFDRYDVPYNKFIIAGKVWQRCRAGKADPNKFGVDPNSSLKGWRFMRDKLVQDLATLNKAEFLLWDSWGILQQDTAGEEALLDRIAEITLAGDETFAQVRSLYEHEDGLRVTSPIISYSPALTNPSTFAF
jgi:hypothetical protein